MLMPELKPVPGTETEAAATTAEVLACGQGWEQAKIVAAFKWIAARQAEMKANKRPWSAEAEAKAPAAAAEAVAKAAKANAVADAEEDEGTETADATDTAIAQAQWLSMLDSVDSAVRAALAEQSEGKKTNFAAGMKQKSVKTYRQTSFKRWSKNQRAHIDNPKFKYPCSTWLSGKNFILMPYPTISLRI